MEAACENNTHCFGGPSTRGGGKLERVQATKTVAQMTYKEGLREMDLFILEKGRLKGDLFALFHYQTGYGEAAARSFSGGHSEMQRATAHAGMRKTPAGHKTIKFFTGMVRQVVQGGCRLSTPGKFQHMAGKGPKQRGLTLK